jgi:hypothetical protein
MPPMARLLLLALALALLPSTADALEIRTGGIVAIRESDHVPDDLLAIAGTVSVLGRVDGDVIALGQIVVVAGAVAGDVIAAGQEVRLAGGIGGDVRAAGDAIQLLGQVDRNVLAAGRRLQLQPGAVVGGSVTGWAEEAFLNGSVGRALWLTAGSARIDGAVGRPARLMVDRVALGPAARLAAGSEYWSPVDAGIAAGAQAPGMLRHEPRPSRELARLRELAAGGGRLLTLGLLASSLVAALLLAALAPGAAAAAAAEASARPARALLVGLAALIAPPVAALLLALTVLGAPLAAALVGLWALALALGWLVAGAGIGSRLGQRRAVWAALGGAAVLWLLGQLPLAGTLVTGGAIALGAGSLLITLRRARLAP